VRSRTSRQRHRCGPDSHLDSENLLIATLVLQDVTVLAARAARASPCSCPNPHAVSIRTRQRHCVRNAAELAASSISRSHCNVVHPWRGEPLIVTIEVFLSPFVIAQVGLMFLVRALTQTRIAAPWLTIATFDGPRSEISLMTVSKHSKNSCPFGPPGTRTSGAPDDQPKMMS
jgi:hypothetical protein